MTQSVCSSHQFSKVRRLFCQALEEVSFQLWAHGSWSCQETLDICPKEALVTQTRPVLPSSLIQLFCPTVAYQQTGPLLLNRTISSQSSTSIRVRPTTPAASLTSGWLTTSSLLGLPDTQAAQSSALESPRWSHFEAKTLTTSSYAWLHIPHFLII